MSATGFSQRFIRTGIGAIVLALLLVSPLYAVADNVQSPSAPDPNTNPMLAQYIKDGIKVYYLGNHSGLDGWFLLRDGQVQVVYTTPDRQSLLLGVLYSTDGQSITEGQVQVLASTHNEIALSIKQGLTQVGQGNAMGSGASMTMNPLGDNTFKPLPAPGEKLLQDLQMASSVSVGSKGAPPLYMIMDPNCPHCQATWRALRDAVLKNSVQVYLIPIGRNDEDDRASAQLLSSSDPLNAWDKYVSGDKTQLAGAANPMVLASVKSNHALIDTWSIKETPYLVYRAKGGTVKVLAGEPQKIETLLGDMGP